MLLACNDKCIMWHGTGNSVTKRDVFEAPGSDTCGHGFRPWMYIKLRAGQEFWFMII